MDDQIELVCIWPLRTPPTEEDLEQILYAVNILQRTLTATEVLALMQPQGCA